MISARILLKRVNIKPEFVMRKILSITLALIFVITVMTACGKKDDAPSGMKLASGNAASYSLYIPESWKVDVQAGYTAAHVSDEDKTNVSVTVYDLEHTNSTVDDWWEVNSADFAVVCTDYKEITIGSDTVLDGVNAKEYVYSAKLGSAEYTYHQVAAVNEGGTVYVITYTCTPDKYESHLETFNKITSEFKF